ncbi:MAG: hypothetical protein K8L99_11185, partial [Anaerolineae bacterium]|nr:hypothetical protein [Anaerolineae bacterium]
MSVWQAADAMNSALLDAQRELFAAGRSDNPQQNLEEAQGQLTTASDIYESTLSGAIQSDAPDAGTFIQNALETAQQALENNDAASLALARGQLKTGLLWASFDITQQAVAEGDTATAANWLRLREFRQATKVTVVDNPAAEAISQLEADSITSDEALAAVGADLRDAYFYRFREALTELSSATADGYALRTAEWAGQLQGYFNLLADDFSQKLSADTTQEAQSLLAELPTLALDADWDALAEQTNALRNLTASYQPVILSEEELAERSRLFYLFTDLIYTEYKDGVRNGEITAPIEYQEATTFYAQAASIFEEIRPAIEQVDAESAARLDTLLAEMGPIMDAYGDPPEIETRVNEALALIESTLNIQVNSSDTSATYTVIDTLLDEIVTAAANGQYEDAERTRIEAYGLFESGPELRLANRAPVLSREIEGLFWEGTGGEPGLSVLLRDEADAEQV